MTENAIISLDDEWHVGEDRKVSLTVVEPGTTTPTPITGWHISYTFYEDREGDELFSKSASIIDAPNGGCEALIDRADTVDFYQGQYFHRFIRTDPGNYAVLAEGVVILQ